MSEEQYRIMSSQELFGANAHIAEMMGIKNFFKVAEKFSEFVVRVEGKGLNMRSITADDGTGDTFGFIFLQANNPLFPFQCLGVDEEKGVWIPEPYLEIYEELFKGRGY